MVPWELNEQRLTGFDPANTRDLKRVTARRLRFRKLRSFFRRLVNVGGDHYARFIRDDLIRHVGRAIGIGADAAKGDSHAAIIFQSQPKPSDALIFEFAAYRSDMIELQIHVRPSGIDHKRGIGALSRHGCNKSYRQNCLPPSALSNLHHLGNAVAAKISLTTRSVFSPSNSASGRSTSRCRSTGSAASFTSSGTM